MTKTRTHCALVMMMVIGAWSALAATPAAGPLRVSKENPRYFTDGSGKVIYLTGAHTWASVQDMGLSDPPPAFDYPAFLDLLSQRHHNFIRGWIVESPKWSDSETAKQLAYCQPHPWSRTGPGKAWDGKPKFDLSKFDEAYFDRVRSRVRQARDRGIYFSIMLFEGWQLRFATWSGHPFNKDNNVNGINGDPNGDGRGLEIQTLEIPAVVALQKTYVRKLIDTVNDLDNVLYEISNESDLAARDWQYEMINFMKAYEKTKPKRHPVGMTSHGYGRGDDTEILFNSPADWISPNAEKFDYLNNPPANTGTKVILLDTDHLWGIGGDRQWVWKNFLRGHNPIWMDPYDKRHPWSPTIDVPANAEDVRKNLGYTLRYADKMDLAAMTPQPGLVSGGYCLAHPGVEYLIYQPKSGEAFSVELKAGTYRCEWFNPVKGIATDGGRIESSGGAHQLRASFEGDAVLYLKALK